MKGRSPRLIQKRNERLIVRYYYWHELHSIRRDRTIEILSEQEFFIEPFTIECILRECYNLLKEIKRKKPAEKQLNGFSFDYLPEPPTFVQGNLLYA